MMAHLPVLLLTAIHYLALGGAQHPLAETFRHPDAGVPGDDTLAKELASFLAEHGDELAGLVATRRTQTNEVSRSTVIAPAMRVAGQLAGGPIALVEVGASAGLNLHFDRYAVHYSGGLVSGPPSSPVQLSCDLRGDLVPPLKPDPGLVTRTGLDVNPLDIDDESQMRWLLACLFPDQPARAARLRAAIGVAREQGTHVRAGDALAVLPELVREVPPSVVPVIMHTWVLAYLSEQRRAEFARLLAELAAVRPLLWLGAEWPDALPGREKEPGDEATVWALAQVSAAGARWHTLANSHDHGSWLTWRYDEPRG
jgi:hypothetical protein